MVTQTVLIAGGSGLVGKHLGGWLVNRGFRVKQLGRSKSTQEGIESFIWNPAQQTMDADALDGVDYVVNLAGANVGEGRWTEKRKKELMDSRIQSTTLLVDALIRNNKSIKKMIQANAVGYYGFTESDTEFMETDGAGTDFLARVCSAWENASAPLQHAGIPLLILRMGVVLSNQGGALMSMAQPVKMLAGAALGSGKQIIPWIHIDDMVAIIGKGIEDAGFTGIYNAAAPQPITNLQMTRLIGKALKKPIWPIHVPSFLLKWMLGEQAQIALYGNRVSNKKLLETGFTFGYTQPAHAINNLLKGV
jgi:uncharacterized protein (TIGR01777 family)